MSDKEMLELAAKAMGILWIKHCVWIENGFYTTSHERVSWNPLQNDDDALRLAIALNIDIIMKDTTEELITEKQAAIRRKIVQTAAEIGLRLLINQTTIMNNDTPNIKAIIEVIKRTAATDSWSLEDSDFNVENYCNGDAENAYVRGTRDGKIILARSLLTLLEKQS